MRLIEHRYWFDCVTCELVTPMCLLPRYRKAKPMPKIELSVTEIKAIVELIQDSPPTIALQTAEHTLETALLAE